MRSENLLYLINVQKLESRQLIIYTYNAKLHASPKMDICDYFKLVDNFIKEISF